MSTVKTTNGGFYRRLKRVVRTAERRDVMTGVVRPRRKAHKRLRGRDR